MNAWTDEELRKVVQNHLRRTEPKVYEEMERDGILEEYAGKVVRGVKEFALMYFLRGMTEEDAWERAIRVRIEEWEQPN